MIKVLIKEKESPNSFFWKLFYLCPECWSLNKSKHLIIPVRAVHMASWQCPVAGKPLGEQGSKCRPAWAWSLNACFSELLALVAVWFLYSVLVSTLQRREWAVCTHISLPPEPLSQCALWVITKPRDELPCVPAGSHQLSTLYVAVCACQPCAEMWVDLESVIASEVSQRKTNIV